LKAARCYCWQSADPVWLAWLLGYEQWWCYWAEEAEAAAAAARDKVVSVWWSAMEVQSWLDELESLGPDQLVEEEWERQWIENSWLGDELLDAEMGKVPVEKEEYRQALKKLLLD
jgi:hypothetical protein